jgi:hypothetical protein
VPRRGVPRNQQASDIGLSASVSLNGSHHCILANSDGGDIRRRCHCAPTTSIGHMPLYDRRRNAVHRSQCPKAFRFRLFLFRFFPQCTEVRLGSATSTGGSPARGELVSPPGERLHARMHGGGKPRYSREWKDEIIPTTSQNNNAVYCPVACRPGVKTFLGFLFRRTRAVADVKAAPPGE